MLSAMDEQNQNVLAWHASLSSDKTYFCKDCKQKVLHVDAYFKTQHFRHYPKKERACYAHKLSTEPESERHLLLKRLCFEKFEHYKPRLEVVTPSKINRADVMIELGAIEVQASMIGKSKLLNRTKKYNEEGIPVLWVFDEDLVNKDIFTVAFIKFLQRLYYGRFYTVNKEGVFKSARLVGSQAIHYKTINMRNLITMSPDSKYGLLRVLRFPDKVWWR